MNFNKSVETWRGIPGYESLYLISDSGRVLSMSVKGRKWDGGKRARMLKPALNGHGYLMVALCKKAKHKSFKIYSLVAAAFIGPRPQGFEVNHKDGIKAHNQLANLEYVTHHRNLTCAGEQGLMAKGTNHWNHKLTEEDIMTIRCLRNNGFSSINLAEQYGVSRPHIDEIIRQKLWKHI